MFVGKKSSKRDLTSSISQQKLSSILGFIASRPTYKVLKNVNGNLSKSSKNQNSYTSDIASKNKRKSSGIEVEIEDYQKLPREVLKLRKNQSMSEMPQTMMGNLTQTSTPAQYTHPFLKYASVHQALSQQKHKCVNLSSQSFQRPNTKQNTLNNKSSNSDQMDKIKNKISNLIQERENLLLTKGDGSKDAKEMAFLIQFNQTMFTLCTHIMSDRQNTNMHNLEQYSLPHQIKDSISHFHLNNIFKTQTQILQQFTSTQIENHKNEQIIAQLKKKNDHMILDNARFVREIQGYEQEAKQIRNDLSKQTQENQKLSNDVKKLETQHDVQRKQPNSTSAKKNDNDLEESGLDIDKQELKYLIQGQFEAIQKLLQREQLVKVFLKRVGDSHILQMFEQFITNSEQIDSNETEGNINVNILDQPSSGKNNKPEKIQTISRPENQKLAVSIIKKYEQSYKQLNLCDSLMADDSRINDSEESSFEYYGKQHTSEVSCQLQPGQGFIQQKKQKYKPVKQTRDLKDKLKINMMDLQLIQANQRRELQKQMELQAEQEELYAQQSEEADPLNQIIDFSFPSQSVKESQF